MAGFDQMGGKRMPESAALSAFRDGGPSGSLSLIDTRLQELLSTGSGPGVDPAVFHGTDRKSGLRARRRNLRHLRDPHPVPAPPVGPGPAMPFDPVNQVPPA